MIVHPNKYHKLNPALFAQIFGGKAATVHAATPALSPSTESFNFILAVTITCATAGSTIYYTTDGSTPTTSSTLYTGPITVSATTTVKAIASAPGFLNSAVGSATYTAVAAYDWWQFTEGAGNTVADTGTPGGNTLSIVGADNQWTTLNGHPAYNFAGGEHADSFTVPPMLTGLVPASVSMWVNMATLPTDGTLLCTNVNGGFEIAANPTQVYLFLNHAYPNAIVVEFPFTAGTHHIVMTYDGSTHASGVQCYLDGVLQTPTIALDGLTGAVLTGAFNLAGRPDGSQQSEAIESDVRLFSSVLNQLQVTYLFDHQA